MTPDGADDADHDRRQEPLNKRAIRLRVEIGGHLNMVAELERELMDVEAALRAALKAAA